MTWAEAVKQTLDAIGEGINEEDLDLLDRQVLAECYEKTRDILNTISLARIATALEKMAGLPYDQVE